MEKIVIENIQISFTRKRIRNINIRIGEPNGEVKVSAPYSISMRRVEKFIRERKDWILAAQQKVINRSNSIGKFQMQLFDQCTNEKEIKEKKKWFEQELLQQAQPYFDKWENLTGLAPEKIVIRWPKTLWGSCDKQKKKIMLNGQLVAMDKKYLDYVVLHELTHLKYSNHGQEFKNFMTQFMPNWKDVRRELNG